MTGAFSWAAGRAPNLSKYELQVIDSSMRRESRHFKTSPSLRAPAQSLCTSGPHDARRMLPIVAGELATGQAQRVECQEPARLDWRYLYESVLPRSTSRMLPTTRWYGTIDIERGARRQVERRHKIAAGPDHRQRGVLHHRGQWPPSQPRTLPTTHSWDDRH